MRMLKCKYIACFVLTIGIITTTLLAQQKGVLLIDLEHPYFDFDFATYSLQDKKHTRLEVYLQISNNEFQFTRTNGVYQANAEISIIAENNETNFFKEKYHSQPLHAENYNETVSSIISQVIQFDFILPVDKYELTARVIDKETKRTSSQKIQIELPDYKDDELNLSHIELCQEIEAAKPNHDKELGFFKSDRWVVPKPNREYGVNENKIGVYFEVYGLQYTPENPVGSFLIQYTISDQQGDIKIEKTHRINKPGKIASISFNPSIENLTTGKYDLYITILDEQTKTQSIQNTSFFRWSNQLNMINEQIAYSINALRFVANSDELKKLKETSKDNLSDALRKFWKSKDPTPYTEPNEALIDFYNRYTITNKAFGSKKTPGWKTDRGSIFLQYGMPEIIYKDKDDALNITKAEVWVYQTGEQFVFVDKFGFGEFRLLPSMAYRY